MKVGVGPRLLSLAMKPFFFADERPIDRLTSDLHEQAQTGLYTMAGGLDLTSAAGRRCTTTCWSAGWLCLPSS